MAEEDQEETVLGLESIAHQRWLQRAHEAIARNDLPLLRQLLQPPWSLARDRWTEAATPSRRLLDSPLVHAVLCSRREIVLYMVRERNERIPFPHPADCPCSLCDLLASDSQLASAYSEVVLMAISSPLYVLSRPVQEDAAQCCINLIKRLAKLPYYQQVNTTLRDRIHENIECSLSMLLDACQSDSEALVAVNSKPKKKVGDILGHVRIMEKCNLVKPLIHRTSTYLVTSMWTTGPEWLRHIEKVSFPVSVLIHFLAYFIVIPITIFLPFESLTTFITRPRSKVILDSISMFVLILIVCFFVFSETTDILSRFFIAQVCEKKSISLIGLQVTGFLVVIFSVSRFAKTSYMMWALGLQKIRRSYNMYFWMQTFGVICYLIGGAIYIGYMMRMFPISQAIGTFNQTCSCSVIYYLFKTNCNLKFSPGSCGDLNAKTINDFFNILLPKFYAHIILSIGHVCNIIPIANILFFSPKLGIVVVMTSKMIRDVVAFAIYLFIIIFSVTVAMVAIYSPFKCRTSNFRTAGSSILTFFWATFGMGNSDVYKFTEFAYEKTSVIEYMGLFFYGAFIVFSNIVLVNLLIAMMTSSFSQTEENKERVWTFQVNRVKIMEIELGEALPVPFNLLYPLYVLTCLLRDKITKNKRKTHPVKELQEFENQRLTHEHVREGLRKRNELSLIHLYPK